MCNNLKIIDSHAHLDFNEIESDLENVINRAKKKWCRRNYNNIY